MSIGLQVSGEQLEGLDGTKLSMKDLAAAVQQEVERKTNNASTSISMINLAQPIDIRNGEFTQSALRMECHELKAVL